MKKTSSKIREEIAKLQDVLKAAETREAERIGRIALKAGLGEIEIEDSALLATFGASGMGVIPAAERLRDDLAQGYGLKWFAPCDGVQEHFYAIGTARKVQHPLVQRLLNASVF